MKSNMKYVLVKYYADEETGSVTENDELVAEYYEGDNYQSEFSSWKYKDMIKYSEHYPSYLIADIIFNDLRQAYKLGYEIEFRCVPLSKMKNRCEE